jgi:hypothetical protein
MKRNRISYKQWSVWCIILLVPLTTVVKAQTRSWSYTSEMNRAYQFYNDKNYLASARVYGEAFKKYKNIKNSDYYNAACSWALAANKDSSLFYLTKAAKTGYSNFKHLSTDSDLILLHGSKRWKKILNTIRANEKKAMAKVDKSIFNEIEQMLADDQKYRRTVWDTIKKYGHESAQVKADNL